MRLPWLKLAKARFKPWASSLVRAWTSSRLNVRLPWLKPAKARFKPWASSFVRAWQSHLSPPGRGRRAAAGEGAPIDDVRETKTLSRALEPDLSRSTGRGDAHGFRTTIHRIRNTAIPGRAVLLAALHGQEWPCETKTLSRA